MQRTVPLFSVRPSSLVRRNSHAVDGAEPIGPASEGCAIKGPISASQEPGVRISAVRVFEVVKRLEPALARDLKDRAVPVAPALGRCTVETPVGAGHEPTQRILSVSSVEAVERLKRTVAVELEDGAVGLVGPACDGCAVRAPVGAQHEPGVGKCAVRCVEAVKRLDRALARDLEDSAVPVGPALVGCAVEIPVRAGHERASFISSAK